MTKRIALPNPRMMSLEAKDDMLRVVDALADQLMITGVDLLESAKWQLRTGLRKLSHASDVFNELFGRDISDNDRQVFHVLLIVLREHAGNTDDDMYND